MNDPQTPDPHAEPGQVAPDLAPPAPPPLAEADPAIEAASEQIQALFNAINKTLIGQEAVVQQVLCCLLAGGHALLEGVPGLGKTLLVRALSRAIGGEFGRVQFTPDLMPADVTGHAMYDAKTSEFTIRKGPIFCNLLLADEANRAPAKTQSALLEAMQEGQVTIEGQALELPSPMLVLATQNPLELEGTYPLPEAQLDRFLMKIDIDYPNQHDEISLVQQVIDGKVGHGLDVNGVPQVLSLAELAQLQQLCATRIRIDEAVAEYAVNLVRATREHVGIDIGSGPRGSISLLRVARALALWDGRDFVTPDDIKQLVIPVLQHRVSLSAELELEGRTLNQVMEQLLHAVDAPRL